MASAAWVRAVADADRGFLAQLPGFDLRGGGGGDQAALRLLHNVLDKGRHDDHVVADAGDGGNRNVGLAPVHVLEQPARDFVGDHFAGRTLDQHVVNRPQELAVLGHQPLAQHMVARLGGVVVDIAFHANNVAGRLNGDGVLAQRVDVGGGQPVGVASAEQARALQQREADQAAFAGVVDYVVRLADLGAGVQGDDGLAISDLPVLRPLRPSATWAARSWGRSPAGVAGALGAAAGMGVVSE